MLSTNTAAKSRSSITLVAFKYTRHHLKNLTAHRLNFARSLERVFYKWAWSLGSVHIHVCVYKVFLCSDIGQTNKQLGDPKQVCSWPLRRLQKTDISLWWTVFFRFIWDLWSEGMNWKSSFLLFKNCEVNACGVTAVGDRYRPRPCDSILKML